MKNPQSEALGAMLKGRRLELGYSISQLARAAGVPPSTVKRFEGGEFAAPRPDKLARFAGLLNLNLADVFAKAGYVVAHDLPAFEPYLNTKYPDLPQSASNELSELFVSLAERHGIEIRPSIQSGELSDEPEYGGAA